MIKYVYIFLSTLFILRETSATHEIKQIVPENSNRELTIILDYQHEEELKKTLQAFCPGQVDNHQASIGAVTSATIVALHQKASPLLVSRSLLKNILDHKKLFNEFIKQDIRFLSKKYRSQRFNNQQAIIEFKEHCIYMDRSYEQINIALKKLMINTDQQTLISVYKRIMGDQKFGDNAAPTGLRNNITDRSNQAKHREIMAYVMCSYLELSKQNWIIKKISEELILLIPKSYLEKLSISGDMSYIKALKPQDITLVEKTLGLKVNHLPDIANIEDLSKKTYIPEDDEEPQELLSTYLPIIFATNKEVKQEAHKLVWCIYATGHGLPKNNIYKALKQLETLKDHYVSKAQTAQEKKQIKHIKEHIKNTRYHTKFCDSSHQSTIISLSIDEFQKLLQFFDKELNLAFFFYASCFAGGEHLVIPYSDKDKKPLNLHYTIASGTLSENLAQQEVPVMFLPPYTQPLPGVILEALDITNKQLALRTTLNYHNFFNAVRQGMHKQEKQIHQLISYVHPYVDQEGHVRADSIANIASLRKAHETYFKVIDNKPSIYALTEDYLKEQNNAQKLNLSKACVVLLYTDHIFPALTIEKQAMQELPAFVSMTPGLTGHVIEQVNAVNFKFSECINMFMHFPELATSKVFWIKKLTCKATQALSSHMNMAVHDNTITLYDVIIVRNICSTDILPQQPKYGGKYSDTCVYVSPIVSPRQSSYKIIWQGPKIAEHTMHINRCKNKNYKEELIAFYPNILNYI